MKKTGLMVMAFLMLWTVLTAEKKIEQAIKELEKKLTQVTGKKKTAILNKLAQLHFPISRPKAAEYGEKALALARETGDKAGEATALMALSQTYRQAIPMQTYRQPFYIRKSLEIAQESLKVAEQANDKKVLGASLRNLVTIPILNKARARKYLKRALEISEAGGDEKGAADTLSILGSISFYSRKKNNLANAMEYCRRALEKKKQIGYTAMISRDLINLGRIHARLGDDDRAISYFQDALKEAETQGDKRTIADTLNAIGQFYLETGNLEQGLKHYLDGLKLRKEMGHKSDIAHSLSNIGYIYKRMKKPREELKYLQEALQIYDETGDNLLLAQCSSDIGEYYLEKENITEALDYFRRAANIFNKITRQKFFPSSMTINRISRALRDFEKEKKTDSLLKNIEIQELKIQKLQRGKERNGFIAGFILMVFVLTLLLRKFLYLFSFWKKEKYIGRFRLMEPLGSGGMGTVYKAHGIKDKKEPAAVKVLKPELFEDENNRKRFKQEGTIIDKLDHPNIVKVFERGEHQGRLYIAMELLQGRTLMDILKEKHRLPLPQSLHIMRQITDAVILLHEKEIIHRDIKPGNIMLISKNGGGEPDVVKLLDFGLAQSKYQSRITETGMLLGTIDYIPPEHITGSVFTASGDVYSLGITFYEMVTGHPVFPGETTSDIIKQILDTVPVAPNLYRRDIPAPLNDLILSMLAKNKETRPSAKNVSGTLEEIENRFKG